jgi:hypothetical protein
VNATVYARLGAEQLEKTVPFFVNLKKHTPFSRHAEDTFTSIFKSNIEKLGQKKFIMQKLLVLAHSHFFCLVNLLRVKALIEKGQGDSGSNLISTDFSVYIFTKTGVVSKYTRKSPCIFTFYGICLPFSNSARVR